MRHCTSSGAALTAALCAFATFDTDGHAPSEYRADTVRNLDAWYDAFKVVPGQKLYLAPADRVRIW